MSYLHTSVFTDLFLFALSFSLQGAGQEKLGIYIKSVVKGGAADVVSPQTKWNDEENYVGEKNLCDSLCAFVFMYF